MFWHGLLACINIRTNIILFQCISVRFKRKCLFTLCVACYNLIFKQRSLPAFCVVEWRGNVEWRFEGFHSVARKKIFWLLDSNISVVLWWEPAFKNSGGRIFSNKNDDIAKLFPVSIDFLQCFLFVRNFTAHGNSILSFEMFHFRGKR